MNLSDLGLLHPEWDVHGADESRAEASLNSSQPTTSAAFPHGIAQELFNYLPENAKTQLQVQQKYMETLVTTTLGRLETLRSTKTSPGGCFYNEASGRDLHLLCKTISKAKNNLKLRLERPLRFKLTHALFEFVTRHSDPSLVFHPKALRTTTSLLESLLQDEVRDVINVKTYEAFEKKGLVPKVSRHVDEPLRLDWRPLYAFTRTILRLDEDRRNHTHYSGEMPLSGETVMALANWSRHFFKGEDVENLFETVFPLLSSRPGKTIESLLNEKPELLDFMSRITKVDQAVIMAHFLPLSLDEHFLDYQSILDQLMELWTLVSDSTQWDRAMASMISTIVKTAPTEKLKWRLDHLKMIFSIPLRQLRLATAGTSFKGPGHPSYSPLVGSLMPAANKPLGKELGSLMVNLLTSELRDDELDLSSASPSSLLTSSPPAVDTFLHWLSQIDSYLHPNNGGSAANHLKNIIRGIVSELLDRMKAQIITKDFQRFMSSGSHSVSSSQGCYDFAGLPAIRHGNLDQYLIREDVWDLICPAFDRIRIHVSASALGKDLALLLSHVRPSYLHSSIFPRITFALENPMLGGRVHVPWSIEVLSVLAPLLMQTLGSPTILSSLLGLLLDHIDANDTGKSSNTFDLALALVLTLTERKRSKSVSQSAASKISLPTELQSTILTKSFEEIKRSKLGLLYSTNDYVKSSEESEQLESEIAGFEANFSEWLIALFERILEYVEGIPSGTPPSPSLIRLLEATADYVDDNAFDLLLRHLSKTVEESPRAKTELNPIITAFALSRPSQTLRACLEQWLTEVKRRATKKSSSKSIESEVDAVAWKLDILRLICKKSGTYIASQEKSLLTIIEPLLKDENQKIRRAALSVLPAALGPLKPHFQARGAIQPKNFMDILLDRPALVEPSKESLALVSKWVDHFVEPALKLISEATGSFNTIPQDSDSLSVQSAPKDLADALKLIFEFISALGPILPSVASTNTTPTLSHPATPSIDIAALGESEDDAIEVAPPADASNSQDGDGTQSKSSPSNSQQSITNNPTKSEKQPLLPKPLSVTTDSCKFDNLPENLRTLRPRIIEVVHNLLVSGIMTGKCLDAKVVRKAFKSLLQALAHNGAKDTKWADAISMTTASLSNAEGGKQKETKSEAQEGKSLTVAYPARYTLSPLHPYYSQWRLNKASSLLQDRWSVARHKLRFDRFETSTIQSFITISGTHPELVRSKKLVKMLIENIPRFSGSTGFMNAALLKVISQPRPADQPEHAFMAQLMLLMSPSAQNNLVANWKNLEQFTTVLQGLHIHDHAMLQMGIARLFSSILGRLPPSAATPLQDPGFFNAYTRIMDSSLKELRTSRPETHWRYHLFPLGLVCALLRRNIHTPQTSSTTNDTEESSATHDGLKGIEVLKVLTKTVGDVLPSARVVSRHAITRILRWAQEANDTSHTSVIEPLLTETSLDTLLAHITIDHGLTGNSPMSLEAAIEKITAQADPSGSIGDGEWGVGADFVMPRTFSLRHADFWYRLFASLKAFSSDSSALDDGNSAVVKIAKYLASRVQDNISSIASPSTTSSTTSKTSTPAVEKLLSVPSSSSPGPTTASSASPSSDHVEEIEKHFFGLIAAVTGFSRAFPERAQTDVWPVLVSAPRLSTNRISSVIFSIAYLINYKVSLDIVERDLLTPFLVPTKGGKEFGNLSPFEVELRLTILLNIYQEAQIQKLNAVADIVKVLFIDKKAASSSRPQIRAASLRLLTLLSAYLTRSKYLPSYSLHASSIHNQVIELLMEHIGVEAVDLPSNLAASVSSVATNQTGSQVPVTPEDRIKTSFLSWLAFCINNRAEIFLRPEWATRITKAVVELTVDSSSATAKMASPILSQLSQFVVPPLSILDQVELTKQLENVKQLATTHPRWKARWSLCFFLRFFCFNHAILMNKAENEDTIEWSKHLIEDANLDVRKAATAAVSSLVRSSVPSGQCMSQLASHFLTLIASNNKNVRRKPREGKDDEPSTSPETLNQLQIGTSGLVALCSAVPYEVPTWLPGVIICLQRLSSHSIGSIAVAATEAVTQFWKTHRDEWHFYKDSFTEDQLRTLEDKPVPSYYA